MPIKESHFIFSCHRMAVNAASKWNPQQINVGKVCHRVTGTWCNPLLTTGKCQQCHLHFLVTLFLGIKHVPPSITFFMMHLFLVGFMSRSSSLDLWGDLSQSCSTQKNVAQIIQVCTHKLWLYFHPERTLFSFLDGYCVLSSVWEQHEIAHPAQGTSFASHKSVFHEASLTLKLLKTVFWLLLEI